MVVGFLSDFCPVWRSIVFNHIIVNCIATTCIGGFVNGKFSQIGKFGQNGKLGHSCTNVTKGQALWLPGQ